MRCDEVTELTLAFIDGELAERRADELRRHLDACPLCRQRYADEVELVAAFGKPPSGLAGADFAAGVMGRLDALPASAPAAPVVELHPWARWALGPMLAAAAIIIVLWLSGSRGWGSVELAAQLARGHEQALAWSTDLGELAAGLRSSGQTAYQHTQRGALAIGGSDAGALVKVVTAIAALACASLVARFRRAAAQEIRT